MGRICIADMCDCKNNNCDESGDDARIFIRKLTKKEVEYEMDVFDLDMAVRVYVYYDCDGNVVYVFSSSS